ncbi:hypothetical protein GCM10018790_81140 [Kitasatospora xanthocidica]|uniref:hypothetical protein n=1 Tax=Kitasatospora xanthocidica TaxID=83382 RepID=UPI001675D0CB|nr:hypothetical protein [Kitasatospora xanthocidica]GHF91797.1 hypothetical protein GCM10018790_81140 [Kitasatospora xanthocidica]
MGVSATENSRYVRMLHEAMPGKSHEAGLLVNTRQWPLLAARMARMEDEGRKPGDHLVRLLRDQQWAKGPASEPTSRLVQATSAALLKPTGDEAAASGVLPAAARAGSVMVGPTKTSEKSTAPAAPAVAPHRAAGPAPRAGRKR